MGCVAAIEEALARESTVTSATVNLEEKTATVATDAPLSVLVNVVKSAGFDASELSI